MAERTSIVAGLTEVRLECGKRFWGPWVPLREFLLPLWNSSLNKKSPSSTPYFLHSVVHAIYWFVYLALGQSFNCPFRNFSISTSTVAIISTFMLLYSLSCDVFPQCLSVIHDRVVISPSRCVFIPFLKVKNLDAS